MDEVNLSSYGWILRFLGCGVLAIQQLCGETFSIKKGPRATHVTRSCIDGNMLQNQFEISILLVVILVTFHKVREAREFVTSWLA
jgi:hypothetical protein